MKLRKIDSVGSLSQQAYDSIRYGILKGKFPLGAPLSRRQLAAELGISFLPVSEAIQRLESEGYRVFQWSDPPGTRYEPHAHAEDQ